MTYVQSHHEVAEVLEVPISRMVLRGPHSISFDELDALPAREVLKLKLCLFDGLGERERLGRLDLKQNLGSVVDPLVLRPQKV